MDHLQKYRKMEINLILSYEGNRFLAEPYYFLRNQVALLNFLLFRRLFAEPYRRTIESKSEGWRGRSLNW